MATKHVPANTTGGWGVAALVIALAILCPAIATFIHFETYRNPRDVMMRARCEPAATAPRESRDAR